MSKQAARLATKMGDHGIRVGLSGASNPRPQSHGGRVLVQGKRMVYGFDQLTETSGRMTAVLDRNAENPAWDFGPDASLEPTADGGAILSLGGQPIALISKPWALDANGKQLKTRFEISGGKLTQVTEFSHGTRFPVVVDPTWKVYPWYVRVTFNRVESLQVVGSIAGCAAVMSKVPSVPSKVISATCAFVAAVWGAGLTEPNTCLTVKAHLFGGNPTGYLHKCS